MVELLKKEIDNPEINDRLYEYQGLILSVLYGRFDIEDVERIITRDHYDRKAAFGQSTQARREELIEKGDKERILREILGPKNSEPPDLPQITINEEEARETLGKLMKKVRPLITEQDLFNEIEVVQDMICGRIKVEKAAVVIVDGYLRKKKETEITRKEDPGKFVIPISIGEAKFSGLCDLGSNISIMPEDTLKSLGIGKMEGKKSTLVMANRSSTESGGVVRDIPVEIGKFKFLTDFIILKFD